MDWRKYEKEIYRYFKETFPNTTIKFDQNILGRFSKVDRQIDILIEGNIAGYSLTIIVDCKYFSKNIDVKTVESFCSMVEDVDAHQGVLITSKGFSTAAINRAYYGNQKVELDIINFDEIKKFQGLIALPYVKNHTVVLPAPFGWVIDIQEKVNGIASIFQRGLTLEKARKKNEWMYLDFWKIDKNQSFSIDDLIKIQNSNIEYFTLSAKFEYRDSISRTDEYPSKIRITDIDSYPFLEVTGFVNFKEFIFYAVLFTPIELLEKNIRKLQYMLSVCQPAKISIDNTQVIKQIFNEIEKTESKELKSEKYHKIGHWYFEMGNTEEALINYRKAIDYFPTHYSYLKEIIDFEFKNGTKEEALKHSSKLFDIEPKNPTVPQDLIEIFLDNGSGKLLLDFFTNKLEEFDDKEVKGNLLFHKGLLFLNMKEKGKARKFFNDSEKNFKSVLPSSHQVFKTLKQAIKESKNVG